MNGCSKVLPFGKIIRGFSNAIGSSSFSSIPNSFSMVLYPPIGRHILSGLISLVKSCVVSSIFFE